MALREVAADANALIPALVILAIAGVAAGIGSLNPLMVVVFIVLVPLWSFVWVGILHLLSMLFGGKGGYMPFFQAYGHGVGLVNWVGVVPFVGGLVAMVWGIIVSVVIVEEVHALPRGKAIAVVLIPLAVLLLCCVVVALTVGAAFFSAMMKGGGNNF
ncbi:MAG: YIP1 family protein [Acidobacteria bacterium]|nr:YIP1 family protein [Acidobacteriota bacterium]